VVGDGVTLLQSLILILVAAAGWAVVTTRNPARQAMTYGFYGLTLAVLFLTFHAPGVALSQALVSGVAVPLLLLFAIGRVRKDDHG